jgi:hypothetical protein
LESIIGILVGIMADVVVGYDLPLYFLLSAIVELTIRPVDKRAVANFILIVRRETRGSNASELLI